VSRESAASVMGDEEEKEEEEKMNLDKFLANHTSEDNESFKEIQEEAFARHRYPNLFECVVFFHDILHFT